LGVPPSVTHSSLSASEFILDSKPFSSFCYWQICNCNPDFRPSVEFESTLLQYSENAIPQDGITSINDLWRESHRPYTPHTKPLLMDCFGSNEMELLGDIVQEFMASSSVNPDLPFFCHENRQLVRCVLFRFGSTLYSKGTPGCSSNNRQFRTSVLMYSLMPTASLFTADTCLPCTPFFNHVVSRSGWLTGDAGTLLVGSLLTIDCLTDSHLQFEMALDRHVIVSRLSSVPGSWFNDTQASLRILRMCIEHREHPSVPIGLSAVSRRTLTFVLPK
jgi:hypothetical protein